MKNVSAFIMITLVAVVGYYVGSAVAQSRKVSDVMDDGVTAVEEQYTVLMPESVTEHEQKMKKISAEKHAQAAHLVSADKDTLKKHMKSVPESVETMVEETWVGE